jgi:hypothetical protein
MVPANNVIATESRCGAYALFFLASRLSDRRSRLCHSLSASISVFEYVFYRQTVLLRKPCYLSSTNSLVCLGEEKGRQNRGKRAPQKQIA